MTATSSNYVALHVYCSFISAFLLRSVVKDAAVGAHPYGYAITTGQVCECGGEVVKVEDLMAGQMVRALNSK